MNGSNLTGALNEPLRGRISCSVERHNRKYKVITENSIMKSRLLGACCAGLFALGIFTSANAALVSGDISLTGGFTPVDASQLPTNLGAATGIDFSSFATVGSATADFAGTAGHLATMGDFQFSPTLAPNPVSVWAVDGFMFDMTSVNVVFQNSNFLLLSGSGTVSGNGFDATQGIWNFSGQTATQITFSWSSSSATVVPVPAAAWLFGSGLLGLVGIARRKNA